MLDKTKLVAPLTSQQKSLWILEQSEKRNGVYNVPLMYKFSGRLNIERMQNALNKVLENNVALRLNFEIQKDSPVQLDSGITEFPIIKKNVSDLSQQEISRKIENEAGLPFDLTVKKGLLTRAVLFEKSVTENYLLVLIHHTLCDGTTLTLFTQEFEKNYNGHSEANQSQENSFLSFANDQAAVMDSADMKEQLAFWKETLVDAPELIELPLDKKRPQLQEHHGDRVAFNISENTVTAVKKYASSNKVTPYIVYLSTFAILLSRYTRQDDIVLGTLVANRDATNLQNMMGYLANTTLIRSQLSEDMTFNQFVSNERNVVLDALSNSDYPIDKLAEKLQPSRDSSYNPLFQVLFVLQNFDSVTPKFSGLETTVSDVNTHTSKVDLNLTITPKDTQAEAFIEYDSELFNDGTISNMASHYLTLLNSLLSEPEENIFKAALLSKKEVRGEIEFAEKNQIDIPVSENMVEVFESRVKATPNKIAVKYNNHSLTYCELNERSNQLAHYLLKMSLDPETKIGVFLDRSLEMIVTILAVLKAGAAYVPIDSAYPQDRINYILENSQAPFVITNAELTDRLADIQTKKVVLEDSIGETSTMSTDNPKISIEPSSLAYIIYTSGSTGRPKGVLVEHHNVIRLIASTSKDYNFEENDIWTMFHSYAFDYSIWEIWGSLLNGATLIVVPYMTTRSPEEFYKLIVDERVTILSQTPAAFRQLRKVDEEKHAHLSLRYITSGGEALDINNLKNWFIDHDESDVKIINMYGITETTVHSTARVIKAEDAYSDNGSVIGKPLADLAIYVLDAEHNFVPRGVVGEMYIAGQGVTRGYLNRPEMTEERFIDNPFHESNYKVYKSGDLARVNQNGELEYIGRADQQVKIRGFRVELGEIESVINDSLLIENAVISIVEQEGVNSLVAYIIPKNMASFDLQKLKDEMKLKLPDYMMPSFFIPMTGLPLTANGKINKRKLPMPTKDNVLTVSENVKPTNDTERALVGIWKDVLGIDEVGITDDFFDLGGHSLLAVKITSVIKTQLGKNLPISVLFDDSTIRDLAKRINSDSDEYLKNPLVQIKNTGSKTPVFIIHPGMGQVMCFNDLVREMDDERPVMAVRAPGLYGEVKPFNNVKKMASYYISVIKKKQSTGPYNLAGYCVGGSIAQEMVHQLREEGEKVNSLSLMDIVPPLGYDHLNEEFIVSFFVEQFFKSFDAVDESVKNSVDVYSEAELKKKCFTPDEYIQYMLAIVKGLNIVDEDYTADEMGYWYDTWKNTILAMDKHRASTIDVPITVYHAIDGDYRGDEWNDYSTISVKTVDIEGDHYSMLKEPRVDSFAKQFSSSLKEFD